MYKTILTRLKRNKKFYRKLKVSLRKIVRKNKKSIFVYLKKSGFIRDKRKKQFEYERFTFKFATFVLLVAMSVSVLNIPRTNAFYNDIESSTGNSFVAGTLGINIFGFNVSDMVLPGNATTTTITLSKTNPTNLDYQYIASSTIVGDATACDYVTISASNPSQNYPSMPLKNFISSVSTPAGPVQWGFTFTVGSGAPAGTCNFKIIYTAWQTDLPNSLGGFSDVAEMTGSIEIGQIVPPAPFVPGPGDVVINELMWMGSKNDSVSNSDDEWIELRNMTGNVIDISGWQLTSLVGGSNMETLMATVPNGKFIPASGFFLISRYPKASSNINVDPDLTDSGLVLRNDDLQIKLYKGSWTNIANLIDTADDGTGTPLRGFNGDPKESMERNNSIPGNGTLVANWHTCEMSAISPADLITMKSYWDSNAQDYNCGTPGHINFSKNDPTASDYDPNYISGGDGGTVPDVAPADIFPIVTEPAVVEVEPVAETPIIENLEPVVEIQGETLYEEFIETEPVVVVEKPVVPVVETIPVLEVAPAVSATEPETVSVPESVTP